MNALVSTARLWLSERFQPCCYRQLAIVLSTDLVKPKAVAVLERRRIEALAHNLPHARGDNLLTFILIFFFFLCFLFMNLNLLFGTRTTGT